MSADGSVSILKESNDPFRIRGRLLLSCAHPSLAKQWLRLFKKIGIQTHMVFKPSYWGGIAGVSSNSKVTIQKFLDIGGFIDGVNVTKKSKRFYNIQKNILLRISINNTMFNSWDQIAEYAVQAGP